MLFPSIGLKPLAGKKLMTPWTFYEYINLLKSSGNFTYDQA
jgi:hypothetical protein